MRSEVTRVGEMSLTREGSGSCARINCRRYASPVFMREPSTRECWDTEKFKFGAI